MLLLAGPALAQPVLNGTTAGDEAFYGPSLSVQNTRTGFGDGAGNPDVIIDGNNLGGDQNGGSEIDQVFATVSGDRLYVNIAGNLEGKFNKLVVFLDASENTGGVNQLVGSALPSGLDGFCCGGLNTESGGLQKMNGLTFDTVFNADAALSFTHGQETVNPGQGADEASFWAVSAHFADLKATDGTTGRVVRWGCSSLPAVNLAYFDRLPLPIRMATTTVMAALIWLTTPCGATTWDQPTHCPTIPTRVP